MIFRDVSEVFTHISTRYPPFEKYMPRYVAPADLIALEGSTGERVPPAIRSLYLRYDFSALEFGEFVWGNAGESTYLEELNDPATAPPGSRPAGWLALAMYPGGLLSTRCEDGLIYASNQHKNRAFVVSHDLNDFVVCCANMLWQDPYEAGIENIRKVTQFLDDGSEFWELMGVPLKRPWRGFFGFVRRG